PRRSAEAGVRRAIAATPPDAAGRPGVAAPPAPGDGEGAAAPRAALLRRTVAVKDVAEVAELALELVAAVQLDVGAALLLEFLEGVLGLLQVDRLVLAAAQLRPRHQKVLVLFGDDEREVVVQ